MSIQKSGQDYLETIYILQKNSSYVRSIDIATELNFSKASVSIAMKHLIADGYIIMGEDKQIELTEKGEILAIEMYERHVFISEWLESIGVPHDIALEDACKIEHDLSSESFKAIKSYVTKHSS